MAEIPKTFGQPGIEIGWPRNLFIFSIVLLLFSGALSLGLGAYQKVLADQNGAIEREVADIAFQLRPEDAQKLFVLDAQIKNLRQLLPSHIYAANLFDLFELNTHPQVRLVKVGFTHSAREVTVQGTASTTELISQQAAAYGAMRNIESFVVKNIVHGVAGYTFSFALKYAPQMVQLKPQQ